MPSPYYDRQRANWNGPGPGRRTCKAEGCPAIEIVGRHPEHADGEITYTQSVRLTPEEVASRLAAGLPRDLDVEYTLAQYPPKEQQ